MNIRRGGIYLAALDPVLGRKISKTRPVVVLSNDQNNEFAGTVTILPITSKNLQKRYPFEVHLPKGTASLPKNSKVNPNVAKVGGLQSQDGEGEAVVHYREPLTTRDLEPSGFPVG